MRRSFWESLLVMIPRIAQPVRNPFPITSGPLHLPVPDYLRAFTSTRRPPRIGVVRDFYREKAAGYVWRHTEKVLARLKKAGARLEEAKMPMSFAIVEDAHRIIMRVEAG